MRLQFLRRCTTSEGKLHDAGDIADVPDDLAADLIRRKMAKSLAEEPEAEEPETDEEA